MRCRRSKPLLPRCRSLGLLLGALLIVLPAPAQNKRDAKREIESLERQWRTAQLAGDVSTMDKMLSDDYVGITMAGQVNTKTQQLARIRNRVFVLTRLDLEDVKVKLVGEVAVVTVKAKVEGTNAGRRVDGTCRYTRIYHHLPTGSWKITNFEATRLPRSSMQVTEPGKRVATG